MAWLASLALALIYSTFVPQTHSLPPEIEDQLKPIQDELRQKGSISGVDLARAEELMRQGQDVTRARIAREGIGEMTARIRQHALAITWIPWMLAAIWLRLNAIEVSLVVVGILGLLAIGLISGTEAAVFAGITSLTLVAKSAWATFKNAP